MKTIDEQRQERRDKKLAQVRRAVRTGSLVVRQMTPEERELYPAQPAQPKS